MQKNIAFCLVFIACAFGFLARLRVEDGDAIDFLTGFSVVFGLQTPCQELVVCVNQSAPETWGDLKDAIGDLEHKNFTGAISQMMEFFKDISGLKNVCSNAVEPYEATFGPAEEAYKKNKAAFEAQVDKNLASQSASTIKAVISGMLDLKLKNYTGVGFEFGILTQIGLSTWLNSTEIEESDFSISF